jgi:dTDP-4-dehydrorhamnose reductase
MKVIITGGGGFVGKALTQFLAPRRQVIALTHRELDLTITRRSRGQ